MIQNYLKTALRSLMRHKEYSCINILGLAIGMGCVILILLFVQREVGFDQFHTNKDRIYRINIAVTNHQTGARQQRAIGPYRLAKELRLDFTDIPNIVRFAPQGRQLVEYQDKSFYEQGICFAEPDVFQVFTFPLLVGDPATALDDPYSVVITEEIAQKYFGDEEPIGKALTFRNNDFKVTGILAEIPSNSQFQFNMFASMNCAEQVFSRIVLENWGEGYCETFVMLPEGSRPGDFEGRLDSFVQSKLESWSQASPKFVMQPLSEL